MFNLVIEKFTKCFHLFTCFKSIYNSHKRIQLNVYYVDHLSFFFDLKILFLTVFKVLRNADNENKGATVVSRPSEGATENEVSPESAEACEGAPEAVAEVSSESANVLDTVGECAEQSAECDAAEQICDGTECDDAQDEKEVANAD